ncbi:PAT1 domain-containing protein [Mycena venus]|uniref:Dolichyl-diphosphooligosaccharide--protein glycosyltransferase subunit WBP1 n=1 Tax=Mycena venus TaxID=2733690 RepID=A0A8H7D2L0_9AGAR|nr:PAT1 domain-containing protein [Mycena venus]
MSFFGFQENNLEEERQRIRNGGLGENEDVAVYTWGEESYDGLGDALQEGGDDLNDETFGGSGTVGKDFDFAGQTSLLEPELAQHKAANVSQSSPAQPWIEAAPTQPAEQRPPGDRRAPSSLESIWDDRSPFSVLPRENGANRFTNQERREPSTSQFSPFPESPVLHQPNAAQGGARTLQEIEAEMRAAALQSRGVSQRQQNALRLQQEEEQFLQDQAYQRRLAYQREREREAERELQIQALQRLQQQQVMQLREQQQHQRTPPPRMLPVSQSPRFLDQRQMLLLQQQEEQQHQLRLQAELQEQLRMEELERQLRAQQISQLNQGPIHFSHRRAPSGPTIAELQALQQQQLHRRQRSQSPAYQDFNVTPQNIQLQQRLLELVQSEYLQNFQGATQAEQEALRAEAMRKIVETEKMEDKRRRKAAKIAHMSRYNDLMTQSDKDFITRIQVSQLVTPDPYADDFYAQVYGAILRSRMGLQTQDERVLKFGTGGGISLGNAQKMPTRRPNAMQRMEQQVERIVSNARRREEEKGLHSLHSLQGALGKTSGRSYKAAPRQLLQVDDASTSPTLAHAHAHISKDDAKDKPNEGAAKEAAKLSRETLGNTGNVVRKDPLTRRQVLTALEAMYDLVLKVEHLRREQPPPEEEEASKQWQKEYDDLVELLWEGLKVMVPLETSNPHPFVSLLSPSKGKKLLPRLTRHIGSSRMLTLMTLLVACFTQLDVVKQAPLLDVLEDSPERAEAERQTQAFLGSVLQSILPIVANLELHVVTALLGLLIERSHDIAAVAKTKPGLALLTLFLSRVEVIKQAWSTGVEPVDLMSAQASLEQWQAVFDQFFVLLTPHFLTLFPSSRITLSAHHPTSAALAIDIIDQPVWQFLAALALQAVQEQHQVLVTSLRDKVLENVLSANKGWVADEDERRTKLANVNLFLHALGLDSSQIALYYFCAAFVAGILNLHLSPPDTRSVVLGCTSGPMLSFYTFVLFFLSLSGLLHAKSSDGDSVLVLVEQARQKDFSLFFADLKEHGYNLTFRAPKDDKPAVVEYDVPAFSHIIVLASESKNFAKDITPQSLVELVSGGSNLLIGLSPKQTPLSSLASEFNLILPPPGTPPDLVLPGAQGPTMSPIWFSGVPFALGNNPLLVPILNAPPESFAADSEGGADVLVDATEKGGEGLWAGSQLSVAAGFQAVGGARVTWVGGVDMLSDNFFKKEVSKGAKSGNAKFARDVAAWTFQESLVLRIDSTTHHLVNTTTPKEQYTTNDNIVFTAHISRFNPKTSTWEPYSGLKDMQLEFTMLDPHIRTALPAVAGSPGKYSVTFRAPDRHGVFKFVINYKRKGFTHLHSSTTVALVPPRHDGYPRFLSAAWPYYAGAISTSVAFFIFSAAWLAGESREKKAQGKKKAE